jgi:hypothetical protein
MIHTTSLSYRSCNKFNTQALHALVAFPTKLRELELQLCPFITDESVASIATAHPLLEILKLEFCKITTVGVDAILEHTIEFFGFSGIASLPPSTRETQPGALGLCADSTTDASERS